MNGQELTFASALGCPTCHISLSVHADGFVCSRCNATYPVQHGSVRFVPGEVGHVVPSAADTALVTLKNLFKRFPRFYRVLIQLFGASVAGISPERFLREHTRAGNLVINLGSGSGEAEQGIVHVDLFAFPGVDVVADISALPFQDQSVDAALCIAVLEHVKDPDTVVREAFRVLKPGGHLYITTPFMQPYHSSPGDYRRWTLDGLRLLLSPFTEVKAGLRHGPTSALALQTAYWLATLFCFGSERVFGVLLVLTTAILMPFAHVFDLPLNRLRVSENMASGYFFIVRKSV